MDDFDRQVGCIAGLPFDVVDMAGAVARMRDAAACREPCFLSTPNLNFLIACRGDAAFRDSVIHSDLSIADGMPLVWMSRLLGLPLPERVAGSGLFDVLRRAPDPQPLSVYFFGGPDGVAEQACRVLNTDASGMRCAGFACPGFGTIEDMSGDETIARINASGADFLLVALGARKGQAWIERNRTRISVPVISHLGAVVNFVAGTVSRAPLWMQRSGLEWLWRIKEEPALWKRYGLDGMALASLLVTRILPYAIWRRLHRRTGENAAFSLRLVTRPESVVRLDVMGAAPDSLSSEVRETLRAAAGAQCPLVVDFSQATSLSPAFAGLLLMLKKCRDARGWQLRCESVMPGLRHHFVWNGIDYLL